MSEESKNSDDENFDFRRRIHRDRDENDQEISNSNSSESIEPDIGLGTSQRRAESQRINPEFSSDNSRREESGSFSFKHFLQTGARPKVYDNPRTKEFRHRTPELASVLPDFVQDHLVVEQCYLADSTIDIEKLPDFGELPLDLGQSPFDLTQRRNLPLDLASTNDMRLPLDLAQGGASGAHRPENLPCDLGTSNQAPLDLAASSNDPNDNPPVALPDFLSDGPIQCGASLPSNEPLDREEVTLRRQLTECQRRCEALEVELRHCREAANHREESLRRANNELCTLRRENATLRQSVGECAQPDVRTQRVARELLAAATHAETSLRQLLSGVESLRLLASTLDQGPSNQGMRPPSHDFCHSDDGGAGPAL